MRPLQPTCLLLFAILGAFAAEPAGAAEPGPVGIHVEGSTAWVAFADSVLRIDLDWVRAPGVVATASGAGARMKWVSTCEGCDAMAFIALEEAGTVLRWGPRDGSGVPAVLKAASPEANWKSVALGEGGSRVFAADLSGDQIRELRIDRATGAVVGDRRLLEIEAPYGVMWLQDDSGLLVTTHDDHLLWTDLEGEVRADWDVTEICRYEVENRGPLRAAVRDPATGAIFALNHRSVLKLRPAPGHPERIASCAIVAGHPTGKGFADGCGEAVRFGHPHGLAILPDASALIVADTDNDALRRVSLEDGDGYGCVSTIPLHDEPPPTSARSCGELGWPERSPFDRDPSRCGGLPEGAFCGETVSLGDARRRCESVGARLCTHFELAADEARGVGCDGGGAVWSATRCVWVSPSGRIRDSGAIAQADVSTGLSEMAPTCRTDGRAQVRCCADAR